MSKFNIYQSHYYLISASISSVNEQDNKNNLFSIIKQFRNNSNYNKFFNYINNSQKQKSVDILKQ